MDNTPVPKFGKYFFEAVSWITLQLDTGGCILVFNEVAGGADKEPFFRQSTGRSMFMEPVSRRYIPQKMLFDTRLIERNLRENFITAKELEAHLGKLSDVSDQSRRLDTKPLGVQLDGTEDGENA
jgi:hypothetical protein